MATATREFTKGRAIMQRREALLVDGTLTRDGGSNARARKSMEGAPKAMQEASIPLLRVSTFGTFRLAWQVAPLTAEAVWESRTSARTLFKLLLCAPGRQAPKSVLGRHPLAGGR